MPAITLAEAEAKLVLAMAAYEKALEIFSYNTSSAGGSVQVSRHSLDQYEKAINFWEKKVKRLGGDTYDGSKGIKVTGLTPI